MSEQLSEKLVRILDWRRNDIEQRLGFSGGKYTDVNNLLAFGIAILITILFFGAMIGTGEATHRASFTQTFLDRGPTPYFIMFFSFWSLTILMLKWRKLRFQKEALKLEIVPHSHDFALAPASARDVLDRMYGLVDDPKHFVLFNRIERALLNLHNIGMISDVSEMLRSQAQNDEDQMESSYGLIRGFIWGVPILGFIGTVLGLSIAIGKFGAVLSAGDAVSQLKSSLTEVTSGLSVAFDCTFLALVSAFVMQLLLTSLKKQEEAFFDDCKDYCHKHIISKLRLSHLQGQNPEKI